ncbi:ATPase associated with various cellular activities AAA_5 [Desulfosarcina variabilis str. Montpellier]|uniref:AAA family ATPase n=1 Tax=Desulfosarcina variabilis TaxID=2300 RepID=UPI003AFB1012
MLLSEKLRNKILEKKDELSLKGELLSPSQIEKYSKTFKARFGPDKLNSIDGETLLDTMHSPGNSDSLVYWLEFKNDEEFPGPKFGSISGGSALKFGIYRRKETGIWMTGSPQNQKELDLESAIEIARKHRDQLMGGYELLEKLPHNATDSDYIDLQKNIELVAPDLQDKAWGHKYFHLMFTNKLDDYHNLDYQRYFLIKLLQKPPVTQGRYTCGGLYIAISKELEMPVSVLTGVLNKMCGSPNRYWRIGTKLGGGESRWQLMQQEQCVAIGFAKIGDLTGLEYKKEEKEKIRSEFLKKDPLKPPQTVGRKTQEIFNFAAVIKEGDIVLPSDGETVLGIGRVDGEYFYVKNSDTPHRIPVKWLSFDKWKNSQHEGLRSSVREIKKTENLLKTEEMILDAKPVIIPSKSKIISTTKKVPIKFEGVPGRIQAILERKGQVILYGPPGTGKTYWAKKTAQDLASQHKFGKAYEELSKEEAKIIHSVTKDGQGLVRLCTFHPAYGYDDFIEGYRPKTVKDQMVFELRDGILKQLCDDADNEPDNKYYLIIDEINRGDIPRIFGELLTIIENDKRGTPVLLPNSGTSFCFPQNVYLLGTMNTADRSIALLDAALRRRFGFIELMPDTSVLGNTVIEGIPLGPWLEALNAKICDHIGRDARNLRIGHAYFLSKGKPINTYTKLVQVMQDDIFPLIEEYCYEDYEKVFKILGGSIVDQENQKIRKELFESSRKDELIQALKTLDTNLDSSTAALLSEMENPEDDEENDADQELNGQDQTE